MKKYSWLAACFGVAMLAMGLASTASACPEGGGRRGPPPEATQACAGSAENQSCQFEAPMGTIVGTCRSIQDQMACVPEGGPGGGPEGNRQRPQTGA